MMTINSLKRIKKQKQIIDDLNKHNDAMNIKYINELMKIKDFYHSKLLKIEKVEVEEVEEVESG